MQNLNYAVKQISDQNSAADNSYSLNTPLLVYAEQQEG